MSEASEGQVQLSKLIFTHNWEDPAVDEKALTIKEGDTLFAITSGCCNALGFLRLKPAKIYCVDINQAQNHLMELKKAAFKQLDYEQMIAFLGLRPQNNRLKTFHALKEHMPAASVIFWEEHRSVVKKGVIMNGRYERFVKLAGWLIRRLQGGDKTKYFFTLKSLNAQKEFYDKRWNNGRWRWIFNTMFNKKRLAKKGLDADYFQFDEGTLSFSDSFQKRARHAMTELPIANNYFLSLYLLGHYNNEEQWPDYLQKKNFEVIKAHIDNIEAISEDAKFWMEKQPDNQFEAMALSNICELMDEGDTLKLFEEVLRVSKPEARLVFRNLMIPRDVPDELADKVVKDPELSEKLQYMDRSFVYSKVAGYTVRK